MGRIALHLNFRQLPDNSASERIIIASKLWEPHFSSIARLLNLLLHLRSLLLSVYGLCMVHMGTSEDNWEAVPSTIGFGGWNEGSQARRQAPAPTESSHWLHRICCYHVPRKCPHILALSNQMVILEEKDFILSILVYPKILCTYTYMQIYMCVCRHKHVYHTYVF